jgi:hypothetical protein
LVGNFPQAFFHIAVINTAHNIVHAAKPCEQRSENVRLAGGGMKNLLYRGLSGRIRPMRLSSDPAESELAIGPGDRAAVEMARVDPLRRSSRSSLTCQVSVLCGGDISQARRRIGRRQN